MKFEDAFDKAFDRLDTVEREKGLKLAVSPRAAKSLVFFWNMMKEAKGKLDDFVRLDDNNNIVSIDHIDPVQDEVPVDVFVLLDRWAKGKKIDKDLGAKELSELLSSANEGISSGVYLNEFVQWLGDKGVKVIGQEVKVEMNIPGELTPVEALELDKKEDGAKDSDGGTDNGELTKAPDLNDPTGQTVTVNKDWAQLSEVLGKDWIENKNFPMKLTLDGVSEIFTKAKKEIEGLEESVLIEWLVKVHGVEIEDTDE